jgi:hypothetical protein
MDDNKIENDLSVPIHTPSLNEIKKAVTAEEEL